MRNKIPFQRIEVFIIDEYTLPHDHGSHNIEELGYVLSSGTIFKTSSDLFKMLDDENRVKIFWLLCHSEECVINITALMNMTSPAVSHHLQLLKAAGLIESRKSGRETYYKAADTELVRLLHKTLEKAMKLTCPEDRHSQSAEDIIRQVHSYLSHNLDKMITIDELARKYHINTTTLKKTFKEEYGMSIAAHMRKHRMEKAAVLLCSSDKRISEIAALVGYNSQSRFTIVFKQEYGMLPTEYRLHQNIP